MRTIRTILVLILVSAFALGGPVHAFGASKPLHLSGVIVGTGGAAIGAAPGAIAVMIGNRKEEKMLLRYERRR